MNKENSQTKDKKLKFIIVHVDIIEKYNISCDDYLIRSFEDNI